MVTHLRFALPVIIILLFAINSNANGNDQHVELLSKHFRLEKPEGNGPFPAVMIVPGCTGFADDL